MHAIHLAALDLELRHVDAETARAAVDALPRALARALAAPAAGGGGGGSDPSGPLRVERSASAGELADRIAGRVAARVHAERALRMAAPRERSDGHAAADPPAPPDGHAAVAPPSPADGQAPADEEVLP